MLWSGATVEIRISACLTSQESEHEIRKYSILDSVFNYFDTWIKDLHFGCSPLEISERFSSSMRCTSVYLPLATTEFVNSIMGDVPVTEYDKF